MATLIKTAATLKTYVSTAYNFTFSVIEPYVKRAEREYIKNLIGDDIYDAWAAAAPTDATELKAYNLFLEASANLSLLLYIPTGAVTINDTGIMVVETTTTKQADWRQIRDLRRSLAELGFSAIDEALKVMEANPAKFPDWADTEGYTVFNELYTKKTQDFQRWFNINNSRLTFVALRPYMLDVQNKIFSWIDSDTIDLIRAAETDEAKQALDYMKASQVNHTVALAAESGLFELSPSGIFTQSIELPGGGYVGNYQKLSEAETARFVEKRQQAGDEYLKLLKTYLLAKTEIFTDYTEDETETEVFVHNTKSIVTF